MQAKIASHQTGNKAVIMRISRQSMLEDNNKATRQSASEGTPLANIFAFRP